jgi:hypothetical protein
LGVNWVWAQAGDAASNMTSKIFFMGSTRDNCILLRRQADRIEPFYYSPATAAAEYLADRRL